MYLVDFMIVWQAAAMMAQFLFAFYLYFSSICYDSDILFMALCDSLLLILYLVLGPSQVMEYS